MKTDVIKKRLPMRCPSCDAPLKVSRLVCGACATEVAGEFDLPVLSHLSEQERSFMIAFVKASGSLKDMAKQLGVSYPTVRNYLDELIEKLNKIDE